MADPREPQLQLLRSARIGPITYRQLLSRFGTAKAALAALPSLAARGGGKPPIIAPLDAIRREIARVDQLGAEYLFLGSPEYPPLLAALDSAPPALILRGRKALLAETTVAMVGARNASAAACRFARSLALDLANAGAVIVSGLARGIDTAAHQGALRGGTIGVIASGIDIHFPPENRDLQERLAQEGLVLTEQPPGTEPLARYFPARNRIIAGLSLGTVVVEAAPRSGSLITARLATEAGREVMAVPGSPLDPRAQGCNLLIREGATLVQSAEDILEAVQPIDPRARRVRSPVSGYREEGYDDASDSERGRITDLLGPVAVPIDEIVRQSSLSAPLVQSVLLELELAGRLERHSGGRVSLR